MSISYYGAGARPDRRRTATAPPPRARLRARARESEILSLVFSQDSTFDLMQKVELALKVASHAVPRGEGSPPKTLPPGVGYPG